MEFIKRGTFLNYIMTRIQGFGGLPEPEAKYFFEQIVNAKEEIKLKKIIHQDIKIDNVLITDTFKVKICDFGLATGIENAI